MGTENRVIVLNEFEHRVMVRSLNETRNSLIRGEKPTEDVDDLLLKVLDAPSEKKGRRTDREAR